MAPRLKESLVSRLGPPDPQVLDLASLALLLLGASCPGVSGLVQPS
jgi:hypothetical protein